MNMRQSYGHYHLIRSILWWAELIFCLINRSSEAFIIVDRCYENRVQAPVHYPHQQQQRQQQSPRRSIFPFRLTPASHHDSPIETTGSSTMASVTLTPPKYHSLTVSYEGQSCEILVRHDETILEALERCRVQDILALPEMPADCRRGNCLTCTAWCRGDDSQTISHLSYSEHLLTLEESEQLQHQQRRQSRQQLRQSHVLQADDGLSPELSRVLSQRGFVLTCSSYLRESGLELELGSNHYVWDQVYRERLESTEMKDITRAACARTIRGYAERNLEKWTNEVEQVLQNTNSDDDSPSFKLM